MMLTSHLPFTWIVMQFQAWNGDSFIVSIFMICFLNCICSLVSPVPLGTIGSLCFWICCCFSSCCFNWMSFWLILVETSSADGTFFFWGALSGTSYCNSWAKFSDKPWGGCWQLILSVFISPEWAEIGVLLFGMKEVWWEAEAGWDCWVCCINNRWCSCLSWFTCSKATY